MEGWEKKTPISHLPNRWGQPWRYARAKAKTLPNLEISTSREISAIGGLPGEAKAGDTLPRSGGDHALQRPFEGQFSGGRYYLRASSIFCIFPIDRLC